MVYMIRQQDTERFQWRGFQDRHRRADFYRSYRWYQFRQWIDEGRTPDEIMEVCGLKQLSRGESSICCTELGRGVKTRESRLL